MGDLLGLEYIQYGFAGFCVILVAVLVYLVIKGFKHMKESDNRTYEMSCKVIELAETNTEALVGFKITVEESRETMKELAKGMKEINEFWRLRNGDLRKLNDKGGRND